MNMIPIINWASVILVMVTATGLLLIRDWRWSVGLLAGQYLGAFWLVQTHWPISMAAAKLVTGWMACMIIGIANLNKENIKESEASWPQGRLFRIFSGGIIIITTFALSLRTSTWLVISLPVAWGGILLIGLGLLQLGISVHPLRVVLGLLTILAGFEILYAVVETSILVTSLLSVVNLSLALGGAYLLNIPHGEKL